MPDKILKSFARDLLSKDTRSKLHYYGDIVRRLFVTGAIIMLITLPFVNNLLPVPVFISLLLILLLGFAAGLTNPTQFWIVAANTIISAIATIIFEYYAVTYYIAGLPVNPLSLINQILALIFLVALYYSVKTLRGALLKKNSN